MFLIFCVEYFTSITSQKKCNFAKMPSKTINNILLPPRNKGNNAKYHYYSIYPPFYINQNSVP